ncbi:leucine-rich repeat-containing protein 37A-like [Ambystoma mexicanum]|uniref:leucine-rich repeat-containing protein 37A-like n=1 Tax=Ambystoma mexicanum TaxID=8296 RepID=UPI0037E87442
MDPQFLLPASLPKLLLVFYYAQRLEYTLGQATTAANPASTQTSTSQRGKNGNFIRCGGQCRCLRHLLSCAGGVGAERLSEIPTMKDSNDTFFFLDFAGNSISALHKESWLDYSWTESLILKQNNLQQLTKDSFEGLLLLKHLDLSSNKIQTIEKHAFEPAPFLQTINLADNRLTKLVNGTFDAWHGMQFLAVLYLSNNPLSDFNDSAFFDLTSLKDLDIGGTKVGIKTIKTIMMTPPKLEKLILPYSLACCLCHAQKKVESLCSLVKLHCHDACDMSSSPCKPDEILAAMDDEFLKTVQSKRINSSRTLHIEPEQPSLASNEDNLIELSSKEYRPIVQVNFNEAVNLLGGLKDVLPKDMPEYDKSNLFAARNLAKMGLPITNNSAKGDLEGFPFLFSKSYNLDWADKNDLKKLSFLGSLLSSDIQGKQYSDSVLQKTSPEYGSSQTTTSTSKCEGSEADCQPAVLQGSKSMKIATEMTTQAVSLPVDGDMITKGNKQTWKGLAAQCFGKQCQIEHLENQQQEKIKEETAHNRQRRDVPNEDVTPVLNDSNTHYPLTSDPNLLIYNRELLVLLSLMTNNTEALLKIPTISPAINPSDTAIEWTTSDTGVQTATQQTEVGQLGASSEGVGFNPNTVTPSVENIQMSTYPINALVQTMLENGGLNTTLNESTVKPSQNMSEEDWNRIILNKLLQSTNEQLLQNPIVIENAKPAGVQRMTTLSSANATLPSANATLPSANATLPSAYATIGTSRALRPETKAVYNATDKQQENEGMLFELQLNTQLEPLIPNKKVRALVCHIIRILKLECSKPHLKQACENLVSKTGLLMKLLSERETGTARDYSWRMYINDSFAETTKGKFPGYGNKLVLAICVTVIITIIIAGICIAEIHSDRSSSQSDTKVPSQQPPQQAPQVSQTPPKQTQPVSLYPEGVVKPLWLQDLQKPLDSVRRKNMAQAINDKESSDEEEIFNKATIGFTMDKDKDISPQLSLRKQQSASEMGNEAKSPEMGNEAKSPPGDNTTREEAKAEDKPSDAKHSSMDKYLVK